MLSVMSLQKNQASTNNIDSKTTNLVSKPLGKDSRNPYAAQTVFTLHFVKIIGKGLTNIL